MYLWPCNKSKCYPRSNSHCKPTCYAIYTPQNGGWINVIQGQTHIANQHVMQYIPIKMGDELIVSKVKLTLQTNMLCNIYPWKQVRTTSTRTHKISWITRWWSEQGGVFEKETDNVWTAISDINENTGLLGFLPFRRSPHDHQIAN